MATKIKSKQKSKQKKARLFESLVERVKSIDLNVAEIRGVLDRPDDIRYDGKLFEDEYLDDSDYRL